MSVIKKYGLLFAAVLSIVSAIAGQESGDSCCNNPCTYYPGDVDDTCLLTWWRPENNLVARQAPFYRTADCGDISPFGDDGLVLRGDEMSLQFSGFVKTVALIDSREVVAFRNNFLSTLPAPRINDVNGSDINGRGQFHIFSLQTRFQGLITGPCIGSAKPVGFVEVDFTGAWINDGVRDAQLEMHSALGGATIRHAFVQLDWPGLSLFAGQFWHPLVPPESPVTSPTAFDNSPFEPVGRYPQIRLTVRPCEWFECVAAALSQFDFKSNGPDGFSTKYMRHAMVPNLHGQARFYWCDGVLGLGIDYKRLVPRLFTQVGDELFKTRAGVSSISAQIYGRGTIESHVVTSMLTYASNLTDELMLGGYAVTSRDAVTGHETYTPIRSIAWLADYYISCCFEPGITVGFTKNLGSRKNLFEIPGAQGNDRFIIYGRAGGLSGQPQILNAIDYVLAVAPRIKWHHNMFTVAAELRWLRAAYGELTDRAKVINTMPVNNIRLCVSLYALF